MRNILVLILLMRLVAWATDMFTWLVLYFYHFGNIIFQWAIGTV